MFALMADILTWRAIADRLEEKPRGAKNQLAKKLGLDPSDLARRLKRDTEPTASQLEVIQSFLAGEAGASGESAMPARSGQRVRVFGYAALGGDDRVALASDQVLDEITVPAGIMRPGAFILRLVGESMHPRLRSGEQVVVEPDIPPVRNEDVLVELRDGTGIVKEYRGQKDGYVFLFQYNPEREIKLPLTQVSRMHAAWPWRRR